MARSGNAEADKAVTIARRKLRDAIHRNRVELAAEDIVDAIVELNLAMKAK